MPVQSSPNGPYRPRPGDRIYRVPRIITRVIKLPKIHTPRRVVGFSLLSFVYGFGVMNVAGAILLSLPVCSKSSEWTSIINSLFTSTSAVCVTGLVVVDTYDHFNFLGQLVIAVLIQLGGLGFMTTTTMLLIAAGRKIGLRGRILIGESVGITQIGGAVRLVRSIVLFTVVAEVVGALLFLVRFSALYSFPDSLWKSIFQSVSAFNNAGFDLFGGFRSVSGYTGDYLVLLTTAGLIILGGISFVVFNNLFRARGLHHSSVDTKLVLLITLLLLLLGTVVILVTEFNNPATLGPMSGSHKVLNAFFQSVTSRTAGFSSVATGALGVETLLFIMLLMFIGGAAGSTAGGIKVNTAGLIAITIWNTIRGKDIPEAFGREFSVQQVFRALTLLVLALTAIAIVFFVLSITENVEPIKILFETVSAFGTVGLSTGITPNLSEIGKLALIVMMFIGRLGPLTLIMALSRTPQPTLYRYPRDSVRIG